MATTFHFCSDSKDEKPGQIVGETVTDDFTKLGCIPHWRRKLSNSWIQPFKHQNLIWNSVEHYYQASKFKQNYSFYYQFSVDSGSVLSTDPELAKKTGDENVIDPDFFNGRAEIEMSEAMFAKFVKNKELHDILVFTKDAILVHARKGIVFYNLMKIRQTFKIFTYYPDGALITEDYLKRKRSEPITVLEESMKNVTIVDDPDELIIKKLKTLTINEIIMKQGDIINASEEFITHLCSVTGNRSCNTITKKYPDSNIYSGKGKVVDRKPGTIIIRDKVINIIGQIYPGKHNITDDTSEMRLSFFEEALKQIHVDSIAFSFGVGCGIYGGKWEKYVQLIKKFTENNPKTIVAIYKLI